MVGEPAHAAGREAPRINPCSIEQLQIAGVGADQLGARVIRERAAQRSELGRGAEPGSIASHSPAPQRAQRGAEKTHEPVRESGRRGNAACPNHGFTEPRIRVDDVDTAYGGGCSNRLPVGCRHEVDRAEHVVRQRGERPGDPPAVHGDQQHR